MLPAEFHYLAKCPKCDTGKKLLCLASGNTFGAQLWSDAMRHAPMLPQLSPIQKCEECGHFYFLRDVEMKNENGYGGETGKLSYEDAKQAFLVLEHERISPDNLFTLRFEFIHRFNDAFREIYKHHYGEEKTSTHPDDRCKTDWELHRSNLKEIIKLLDENKKDDQLLIAEFYREAGDFENSLRILERFEPEEEFLAKLKERMKKEVEKQNSLVFEITGL